MAAEARIDAVLRSALERHGNVAGVSVGLIEDYAVRGVSAGYARVSTEELLSPHHYLEAASLSKTVATAFAIEYYRKRGVDFATASVNSLLEAAMSPWRVTLSPSLSANERHWSDWPSKVTLAMLVNHTALGMHYVYGVPLDVCQQVLHPSLQLLDGTHEEAYGYKPLFLEREPGSTFAYSGGGFITLQHLIECTEGGKKTIEEITRPWLDAVGLRDFTFSNTSNYCAFGHLTRRKEVPGPGGRLAFPAFAAGALCTPAALARFLSLLARAYQGNEDSPAWLSSETAKLMLGDSSLQDKGAVDFMRAKVGLGVFVATAGDNKFILHQAANEGFRGVYLVCFDGPDQGNGFVLLCNGDNPAVLFQCDVCRQLLGPSVFNFSGISFEGLAGIASFDMAGLKQETIVNLGLKELVLAGFSSLSSSSSRISSKL
jgi:CubicO group peptidase (beta-lactamase class C family)